MPKDLYNHSAKVCVNTKGFVIYTMLILEVRTVHILFLLSKISAPVER